jgi:integrase
LFDAGDLRKAIDAAGVQMKAMLLLGINAGFGGADCGTLPMEALDLDRGWVTFPRPKTGVPRRCPLWPETVAALRGVIDARRAPKDSADANLVFITKYVGRWDKGTTDNPISKEMAKLLKDVGVRRKGLSFYALRHTTETLGGEAKDQPALDLIMGHASDSRDMGAVSQENIKDDRLQAVVDRVRAAKASLTCLSFLVDAARVLAYHRVSTPGLSVYPRGPTLA